MDVYLSPILCLCTPKYIKDSSPVWNIKPSLILQTSNRYPIAETCRKFRTRFGINQMKNNLFSETFEQDGCFMRKTKPAWFYVKAILSEMLMILLFALLVGTSLWVNLVQSSWSLFNSSM